MATERFDKDSGNNRGAKGSGRSGSNPVVKNRNVRSSASDAVAERLRKKIGVRRAISAWMNQRDS